jgi:hypothetical protein
MDLSSEVRFCLSELIWYGGRWLDEKILASPFDIDLSDPDGSLRDEEHNSFEVDDFGHLFPAAFRPGSVLEAVTVVEDFLAWELDLDRIEDPDIFKYLFSAGIRTVPKQLTVHCSLGTEIKIVELMDLHLILEPGKILLKPIPRYLLCSKFWVKHLIYCPSGDNRFNSPIQHNPEDAIPSKL